MKIQVFRFLLIAISIVGCTDHDQNGTIEGTYSGTFYRVTNGVKGHTSNVTLTFSGNEYSGNSSVVKYPALCNGTFTQTAEMMSFTNGCMWTAEFDWTLILSGDFKITRNDDELILVKERNPDNADYYVLKRGASSL